MSGPCTGHAAEIDEWMAECEGLLNRYVIAEMEVTDHRISSRAALLDHIRRGVPDQIRDATEMAPAPAEVPMPEEIGWVCWNGTRIGDGPPHFCTYEPTAHQLRERVTLLPAAISYGDAREAAGYARGLNERNAGDETLAMEIDIVMSDGGVTLTPGAFRALSFVRAALRGEVK